MDKDLSILLSLRSSFRTLQDIQGGLNITPLDCDAIREEAGEEEVKQYIESSAEEITHRLREVSATMATNLQRMDAIQAQSTLFQLIAKYMVEYCEATWPPMSHGVLYQFTRLLRHEIGLAEDRIVPIVPKPS